MSYQKCCNAFYICLPIKIPQTLGLLISSCNCYSTHKKEKFKSNKSINQAVLSLDQDFANVNDVCLCISYFFNVIQRINGS